MRTMRKQLLAILAIGLCAANLKAISVPWETCPQDGDNETHYTWSNTIGSGKQSIFEVSFDYSVNAGATPWWI